MIGKGESKNCTEIRGEMYAVRTMKNNFIPKVVSGGPSSSSSLSVEALVASSSLIAWRLAITFFPLLAPVFFLAFLIGGCCLDG